MRDGGIEGFLKRDIGIEGQSRTILAGFGIEGASAAKLRAGSYKNRDGISGLDSKRRGILGLTPPVYPPLITDGTSDNGWDNN